jgi:hypothetical protein
MKWTADIGRILATLLVEQRHFSQEQADFMGVSLEEYAAAAILEYLEANHGDDLEIIDHDVN